MQLARVPCIVAFIVLSALVSEVTAFVVPGKGSLLLSSRPIHHETLSLSVVRERRISCSRVAQGVGPLRASTNDEGEGGEGGFVNPYTAFRKWQKELIDSKAKNNDKYPEAYEGLMKEPGMTPAKAERLAKIAVSDPILYSIERRREANEINKTKMDYRKIDGFFPIEWILSGDFGWGFNRKKARLAAEKKAAEEKAKEGK